MAFRFHSANPAGECRLSGLPLSVDRDSPDNILFIERSTHFLKYSALKTLGQGQGPKVMLNIANAAKTWGH